MQGGTPVPSPPHDARPNVKEKQTWNDTRDAWRNSSGVPHTPTKKKLPSPPVNGVQVVDEFVNQGGRFSTRVPLPDMVSILVELWEMEEL